MHSGWLVRNIGKEKEATNGERAYVTHNHVTSGIQMRPDVVWLAVLSSFYKRWFGWVYLPTRVPNQRSKPSCFAASMARQARARDGWEGRVGDMQPRNMEGWTGGRGRNGNGGGFLAHHSQGNLVPYCQTTHSKVRQWTMMGMCLCVRVYTARVLHCYSSLPEVNHFIQLTLTG